MDGWPTIGYRMGMRARNLVGMGTALAGVVAVWMWHGAPQAGTKGPASASVVASTRSGLGHGDGPGGRLAASVQVLADAAPMLATAAALPRAQAEQSFEAALARLRRQTSRERRTSARRWQALRQQANLSFNMLARTLDAKNPEQAAELEQAHEELVRALQAARWAGAPWES